MQWLRTDSKNVCFTGGQQCRVDFLVESYSMVFLCGNTTNGNSSSTLPS